MIPIHLDALVLAEGIAVEAPLAEFRGLPFVDRDHIVNPNAPNLGETTASQSLESRNTLLMAGVHLHWALPDALTRGNSNGAVTEFPAVPNRWLVTRKRDRTIQRQWVVESDYLFPAGAGLASGSITYPNPDPTQPQRYRFLGRTRSFFGWTEPNPEGTNPDFLDRLTAVGYGDPNFAAFYPSCHGVFGFHDPDITRPDPAVTYQVIGWYAKAEDDVATRFEPRFSAEPLTENQAEPGPAQWAEALAEQLGWIVDLDEREIPRQSLCYAHLSFVAETAEKHPFEGESATPAVGNTATEALSAFLANKIGGGHRQTIEDQLEALHLDTPLKGRHLDVHAKLIEARHEKGFSPVGGGVLWTIKPKNDVDESNSSSAHS